MNRREFLHPRKVAQAAGQVLAGLDELQTLTNPVAEETDLAGDVALVRYSRRAMATSFEVVLPFATPHGAKAADEVLDEIDQLEDQLTVYRDASEVSRLNAAAALTPVVVEARLFDLLRMAGEIHAATHGAFDVTAGALIKAWGFYRGPRRVPEPDEIGQALNRVGMHHLLLDSEKNTVQSSRLGLEINLGSIGKGYALDRAAEILRDRWNIPAALLQGGHSSVYALGSEPGSRRGWPVGIRHPWNPETSLAKVWLHDRGLATSAATFQHLEHQGRRLGHILDPRTGWPAEGMASVSVVAPTSAEADALATAFFILGLDQARAYCKEHPKVGAVLLPEGPAAPVVILNLSPQEISLVEPVLSR